MSDLWDLARKINDQGGGLVAIFGFVALIWAVFHKRLRLGREFDEMVIQRDFWREHALRSTDLVERNNATTNRALAATDKAIEIAKEAGGSR